MSAEKNRCGVDTSRCTDWTTTRRSGYKPGPNDPIEPQYTASRSLNSTGKSATKSGSKKKSAVRTNKATASATRSGTMSKSKSMKRDITPNSSMTRTNATQSSVYE